MEEVEREPNRFFLGRVPLVEEARGLFMLSRADGERQAAWVKFGTDHGALSRWLADDPHLKPFLAIPSKENGFDVEGIAVRGNRVWLGLRGPVLRGHAVDLLLLVGPTMSLEGPAFVLRWRHAAHQDASGVVDAGCIETIAALPY